MSNITIQSKVEYGKLKKTYFINGVKVLVTTWPDNWDDMDFKKYCTEYVKAITVLIADDMNNDDRCVFTNRHDFKYVVEMIEYAQHMNPVLAHPISNVHPTSFLERTRPEEAITDLYETTNNMDMVDLFYEIGDKADDISTEYVNTYPMLPTLGTYNKGSGKGYYIYLSANQYNTYMNLPDDAEIYNGIQKKDIDYISVHGTRESINLDDLQFT